MLNTQPTDNQFQPFTIDYSGDTKDMTVTYAGQTWTQNMNNYFKYTKKDVYALGIAASTGGAYNLQQIKINEFTYTASALLAEYFVDQDTGEQIDKPLRVSGDIDSVVTVEDHTAYLQGKGYKLISKDTSLAPDYNEAKNNVKLTNATQFIVYTVKDVEAPKIADVENATNEVNTPITPIVLDITDNSGSFASKTVTGLPAGLTFDETTNTISGTPTSVGQETVTVTATDHAGLTTTKTFTFTVTDTQVPTINDVDNKTSEAYTPITPITLSAEDNSKNEPTLTVTGLPAGLTFDSTTKQITGKPTSQGTSTVTITATDASNNSSTKTFEYTVQPNQGLEALKTAVAEAKAVTKDEYTPNSVAALDAKVAEAEAIIAHPENSSTDAFNAKAQEVTQSKNQLVHKADKTELEKAIAEGDKITNLNPGKPLDQQLQNALAEAKNVDKDLNATQNATDDSKNKLNSAIQEKLRADAYEKLQEVVARGANLITAEGYTPESVQVLKDLTGKYNDLIMSSMSDDPTVRQKYSVKNIEDATKELNDGIDQLKRQADKTELNKAIAKANTLNPLETSDTEDKAVLDKLAEANQVKEDANATKEQVDNATADLNQAIDQKLYQDALDRLNEAIADAKGVDKTGYTPSSVGALEKAIQSGETAAANTKSTPAKLDKAAKAITKTKAQLINQATKDELKKAIEKAEKLGVLNPSDNEDNFVHDRLDIAKAADADKDAEQEYVDFVTAELNKAINQKLYQDALDELNATINDAETVDKTIYTPETVTPIEEAINDGKIKAADTNATPEQLKTATQAIKNAKDALKQKANKEELNNSIATAEALQPLQAGDAEDDAVKAALDKAKAVQGNDNADQNAVDAAKDALNQAIEAKKAQDAKDAAAKQAALDELKAELAKVAQIDKNNFTPDSVTPLTEKENAGKAIVGAPQDKTVEEIKEATKALQAAEAGLQAKSDKAALQAAIDKAEAIQGLNPADTEDKAVQDKLAEAKTVKDNPNASQQEVQNATKALNDAVAEKEHADALDALKAELKKVGELNKDSYTPDSVTPLNEKETTGKDIVANPDAKTTDEIKAATEALKQAEAGLVDKADKGELQKAIDKADALNNLDAADKEDKAVQDKLADAKTVKANENATPEQVAEATKALNDAVAAKERQDALDELQKALDDAAQVNKDQYKPDSVAPFEAAVNAGTAAKADATKTPAELKEAAKAIKDAKDALEAKADKTALDQAVTNAEGLGNLDPSDKEDKAVKDALDRAKEVQANQNANQPDVDAAKDALNQAIEAKKAQDAKDAKDAAAKQAALDELKAELAKVAQIDKNNFTPDSVTPLTEKETAGQAIVDAPDAKTTDEIKAATEALKQAETGLVNRANKDELQKAIDKADALNNLDATDKEDKAVQDKLADAKTVKANENATPEQVAEATKALNDAVAAKERQDALDELQKALDDAAQVNKDQYKPDSVAPFEAAVNAGTAAKADATKTPAELKEAAKAIKDAKNALQEKANKEGLNNSVTAAEALQPLKDGDAEDEAVKTALEKAKEVQADQNTDQATVDAAKEALDNAVNAKQAADAKEKADAAQAKQEALDALKAELAKVAQIDKNNFTPDSVTPLTEKETAGQAIVDAPDAKTTDEIKAATEALKQAEAGLVDKADKAELQKAIDKADALNNLDAADKEDKAVQDKLADAKTVKANDNATPEQVAETTKALNDAVAAKERQDALDELQKALDDAAQVNKDQYKPNTVTPLEEAVKAGETTKADATKTPEELKEAAKAIKDAKDGLEVKADKTALDQAITNAEALRELNPADAEDKAVQDALNKAKEVQADQNANQPDVDAAKDALNKAIDAKKAQDAKDKADAEQAKQDALNELKAELEKVKGLDKDTYTPNTVTPLTEKETAGQAIVDAPDAKTTDEIKEATKALKDVEAALVKRADKGDLEKAIEKAEALGQLDETDAEDKAVKDVLAAGKIVKDNADATPEQVAEATKSINDAIAAKEHQDALDELNKVIDKAQNVEKADYTPESVKPLDTAEEAGQTLAADKAATTEQLKAATKLIQDAINQLVPDKSELTKQIDAAKAFEPLNDSATDQLLKQALDAAIAVQNNPNAQPQEIKEAAWNLESEIGNKIAADAIEALREAVNKSNALDETSYTPNSFAPLKTATTEGQSILDDPSSADVPSTIAKAKEIN
ncbi:putative Ig domain-containing protein [Staphylococcus simulans]